MNNRKRLVAGIALTSVLAAATTGVSAADKEWKMATPWGGGPWLERDAQTFANYVNQLTSGDIEIEVFPGGTLGGALRVTNTVKAGVADVSHNYINYDYGTDPTAALLAGHSSGLTPEEFMMWMYEGGGAELYEEFRAISSMSWRSRARSWVLSSCTRTRRSRLWKTSRDCDCGLRERGLKSPRT